MCKASQGDPGRDQRSLGTSGHEAGGASKKQKGHGHFLALKQQQKSGWPEQGLGEGWE